MNVSRAFRRLKLGCTLFALFVAVPTFAQTVDSSPQVKQEVLDKIAGVLKESAFVPGIDFSKWDKILSDQRPAIDAAKSDDEFRAAVDEALDKFGASHVTLLTPRMSQARRTGASVGVGISIQVASDGLAIVRVIKDGPADKAGLAAGDTIVEFEGRPIIGVPNLMGDEGSVMSIKVKHTDGKLEDYKIVRKKYSTLRLPELSWVDKDTALLKIFSFEKGYDRDKIADDLKDALKAKNLILDLRYNGGGRVVNLQHLLGMLIPGDKPVGTFIQKSTIVEYIESTGGDASDLGAVADWSEKKLRPVRWTHVPIYKGHIAVLIDKFTGSAAEIAAAGLRDVDGASVVGTKSAGAVLASVIDPVSNGFMLQYPMEDYITIKGVRLEGNGVTPDIEAQDPNPRSPNAPDEAVEKATALLEGKMPANGQQQKAGGI